MSHPSFLPASLPDESLFSIVCSYHLLSGNSSANNTRGLFVGDRPQVTFTADQTARLVQRLSDWYGVTDNEFMARHTCAPYWSPFLFTAGAIEGTRDLNLAISLRQDSNTQCFCPHCVTEDTRKYGRPYWHRSHQLPYVHVCHKHEVVLMSQSFRNSGTDNFQLPRKSQGDPVDSFDDSKYEEDKYYKQRAVAEEKIRLQVALDHARLSHALLTTNLGSTRVELLPKIYIDKLRARRIYGSRSGVNTERLFRSIEAARVLNHAKMMHWPIWGFFSRWQKASLMSLTEVGYGYGARSLYNRPARHIVMIRWLFGSVEEFAASCK